MIMQGGYGTKLNLTVKDSEGIVNLNNSTVKITLKNRDYEVTRDCVITDPDAGLCQYIIQETDTVNAGQLQYQLLVIAADGSKFPSTIGSVTVEKSL